MASVMSSRNSDPGDDRYTKFEKRALWAASLITGAVLTVGIGWGVLKDEASTQPESGTVDTTASAVVNQAEPLQDAAERQSNSNATLMVMLGLGTLAAFGIYEARKLLDVRDTSNESTPEKSPVSTHVGSLEVVAPHDVLPKDMYYDDHFSKMTEFLVWDEQKGVATLR